MSRQVFEPLPPIKTKVDCAPREFLERMAAVAERGEFTVEKHYDAMGEKGLDILNLRFTGDSEHEEVGGQLIVHQGETEYVAIEVRASNWHPQTPPSYNVYVEETKKLFRPLLSAYNKKYSSNRRLNIKNKESLKPKLSPKCEDLFRRFTTLANTSVLHPLDWNRFYKFVAGCRNRDKYSEGDIARLLMKEGFRQEYAEHIGSVYDHLCNFKRYL